MKIAIIGGSIAGCSTALALRDLDFDIQIFEKSHGSLIDRGNGIVMPAPLLETLRQQQWIDHDAPCLPLTSMQYSLLKKDYDPAGYPLWQRTMEAVAWRWGHLFSQLRKRIPNHHYHSGAAVTGVESNSSGIRLKLNGNREYQADLVVFADGLHSLGRQIISRDSSPQYAGYVLWRGLLNETPEVSRVFPSATVSWHPFPGGLAGSYYIPSESGDCHPGQRSLNWGVYQQLGYDQLRELLADNKNSGFRASHVPLTQAQRQQLQELLRRHIPAAAAELLCKASSGFVQPIIDISARQLVKDQMLLSGDAAAVLRPHTASGAVKAIDNALSLRALLANRQCSAELLLEWQQQQLAKLQQQTELARLVGDGYINNAPPWQDMNPESLETWWQQLLAGKHWYLK